MLFEVKGLVIRTVNLSESDRLITLFTDQYGLITAYANNSRSLKSRYMSAAQLFCYGSYVLYKKGERFWVREVELIENFFGLRASIEKTALASYLAEVLCDVITSEADEDSLRLALNTLYAIEHDTAPLPKLKAAFELRLAAGIGFMPEIEACTECGKTDGELYLDILDGVSACPDCREYAASERVEGGVLYTGEELRRAILMLSEGVRAAMRYTMHCPLQRLFAFRLTEEEEATFELSAEQYLLTHLDRGFETLKFYKDVTK